MNVIYKFLANIKHKLIFIRYGRVHRPDTIRSAKNYLSLMQIIHNKEYLYRKKIANECLSKNDIDKFKGYKIINFVDCLSINSRNSLEELKKKYQSMDWTKNLEMQQKSFLAEIDVKIDNNVENIINDLAPIVAKYIGSWPIVKSVRFWYSSNIKNTSGRSQDWHMDAEDLKQVKVLIPVEEITEDHGPMNIMPANITKIVYEILKKDKKTKFRNEKHSDIKINSILQKIGSLDDIKQIKLKSDQIGLVDTCSCYHYGSRKAKFPRKVISIHFTSAFSIETPIFRRNFSDLNDKDLKKKALYCFLYNNYNLAFKNSKKLKRWELKIL